MPDASNHLIPPRANRLLAMLSDAEYDQWASEFQRVRLEPKASMVRANAPISVVDFPLHGVASQLATLQDGTTVEVGPIGCEGTTGLPLFLGAATTPIETLMQIPGECMRLPAGSFRAAV